MLCPHWTELDYGNLLNGNDGDLNYLGSPGNWQPGVLPASDYGHRWCCVIDQSV
jgi:hypothetical protein